MQVFQQGFALFTQSSFQNGAAGNHDVVAFFVQFDDFEFDFFAFKVGSVFNGTYVNQRTRQECADAVDHNGQAAFDFAIDNAGQDVAVFHRFFQSDPVGSAFGFFAGQFGFAEAVFNRFDGNGNEIANFNFNLALSVFEFGNVNQRF